MFGSSAIKLGKVFGIEIEIDYSWIIIFLLVTWLLVAGIFPQAYPQFGRITNLTLGIVTAVVFFVCVIIHELSHSLVARSQGITINKITLFLFGGVAQATDEPETAAAEFKMAIAGPLTSIVLSVFFWILYFFVSIFNISVIIAASLGFLAQINLILAIFNLVPGFPLDGGRVFRAILWHFNKDLIKSTRTAVAGGKFIAITLILTGILQVILGDLGGIWLTLIGFFLDQAATASLRQLEISQSLSKIKVNELMSDAPVTILSDLSLKEMVEHFVLKYNIPSFLVSDGTKVIGLMKIENLQKVPRSVWTQKKVLDLFDKFKEEDFLEKEDPVYKALKLMSVENVDQLPVMKGKKLLGVIKRENIARFLLLKLQTT